MAAFATPDDLADYLGRDRFTEPAEYRQAVMVLNLASGEIRAWTRQTIDLVTNDAVVLAGSWGSALRLPEQPVVSVSSVSLDGTSLVSGTDYELACGILLFGITLPLSGVLYQGASSRVGGAHWGGPGAVVAVTYTHGFADVPMAVKNVTLSIASRLIEGAGPGVQRRHETIAGWSETVSYGVESGSLSGAEMESIRYLRRTW